MSVGSPARRRRLEPHARRAQILAVARRMFGASDYAAVSTSDIAKEAGVTRALVHHYFGSKRALYLAAVRQMVTFPLTVIADLPKTAAARRLAIGVDNWLDLVERNQEMWLAAIGPGSVSNDTELAQVRLEADEIDISAVLETAMMADVAEGKEELRAMIRAFGGMWRAASREWLVRRTLTRADLHLLITESLMHLLKVTFPAVLDAKRAADPAPGHGG